MSSRVMPNLKKTNSPNANSETVKWIQTLAFVVSALAVARSTALAVRKGSCNKSSESHYQINWCESIDFEIWYKIAYWRSFQGSHTHNIDHLPVHPFAMGNGMSSSERQSKTICWISHSQKVYYSPKSIVYEHSLLVLLYQTLEPLEH